MKLIIKQDHLYFHRRIIRRFALLPISLDDEIRWLETVYIAQAYSTSWGNWYNEQFANRMQWELWEQDKALFIAGLSSKDEE
jgi:hypothetical protein